MRKLAIILIAFASITAKANNPYRAYLLSKIPYQSHLQIHETEKNFSDKTNCVIPRFKRPKGAVFCRMEDYLTTKTKVWFKVGVQ